MAEAENDKPEVPREGKRKRGQGSGFRRGKRMPKIMVSALVDFLTPAP
jgi:hypothetical protein